jgi:hypothetical protein
VRREEADSVFRAITGLMALRTDTVHPRIHDLRQAGGAVEEVVEVEGASIGVEADSEPNFPEPPHPPARIAVAVRTVAIAPFFTVALISPYHEAAAPSADTRDHSVHHPELVTRINWHCHDSYQLTVWRGRAISSGVVKSRDLVPHPSTLHRPTMHTYDVRAGVQSA